MSYRAFRWTLLRSHYCDMNNLVLKRLIIQIYHDCLDHGGDILVEIPRRNTLRYGTLLADVVLYVVALRLRSRKF